MATLMIVLCVYLTSMVGWTWWADAVMPTASAADDDDGDDDDGDDDDDDDDDGQLEQEFQSAELLSLADGEPWVSREIIGLDLTQQDIATLRQLGFSVIRSFRLTQVGVRSTRLDVPRGLDETDALELARDNLSHRVFTLNHVYRLATSACVGERCVPHRLIAWPEPQLGSCRTAVRIGMLDTAVDQGEAGLGLLTFHFARFTDATRDSDSSHGSAVAGLIAGKPERGVPGLLPASTLYSADVVSTDRSGNPYATAEAMARGIDWLLDKSLNAINISLNGSANQLVELAVDRTAALAIPVLAAVGNEGNDSEPSYPAAYPSVIAVTAVDARRRLYGSANRGEYVALAAPGVNVWTPSSGGEYRTGTSFATPFVTAVAALLHHRGAVAPDTLERTLAERTLDLGPPGRDPLFGWGLIQGEGLCR